MTKSEGPNKSFNSALRATIKEEETKLEGKGKSYTHYSQCIDYTEQTRPHCGKQKHLPAFTQ